MHSNFEKHHFDCNCTSDEHTFSFVHDSSDGELYLSVFLNKYGFFRRAWTGLKFILGYKSKYGHWDCVVLDKESTERLRDLCNDSLVIEKN